jgi:hypothetical protein
MAEGGGAGAAAPAPPALPERLASRYIAATKRLRAALEVPRPLPGDAGLAAAARCARAAGVCEYSGAPLAPGCALEVDHCVPLATVQELMWQASLAHGPAKGRCLPWSAAGAAFCAARANALGNLRAVSAPAHKAKSTAALGYAKHLAGCLKRCVARPAGLGITRAADFFNERARVARARAPLRADFADLVASQHRALGTAMRSALRAGSGLPRHQRLLALWVASALMECGGAAAQQAWHSRVPLRPAGRAARAGAAEGVEEGEEDAPDSSSQEEEVEQ